MRQPRYFVGSDATREGVALRPVFVSALDSIDSPLWPAPIWSMPASTDLVPGSFLFTSNAEFAGLVTAHQDQLALVPAAVVLAEAERLLNGPVAVSGSIGIEVQALTPALAAAAGAPAGVVVTFVNGAGVASGQLMVGDVIVSVNGLSISSPEHWQATVLRLPAGSLLSVAVHRRSELQKVELVTPPQPEAVASESLGLTLRRLRGIGSQVVGVQRGSAADRAGLTVGDTITLIADVQAPAPDQVQESYATTPPGQHVMVAVSRGDAHRVTTLAK
jgi:S1-C subfamily serine protease